MPASSPFAIRFCYSCLSFIASFWSHIDVGFVVAMGWHTNWYTPNTPLPPTNPVLHTSSCWLFCLYLKFQNKTISTPFPRLNLTATKLEKLVFDNYRSFFWFAYENFERVGQQSPPQWWAFSWKYVVSLGKYCQNVIKFVGLPFPIYLFIRLYV